MKKKFNYLSVFSPQELWGKEQIADCTSLLREGTSLEVLKSARQKLRFYQRFDPAIPHDRVFAQIVTVSIIYNPTWPQYRRKLVTAEKNPFKADEGLEQKIEIDFGELAQQVSKGIELQNIPYFNLQYDEESFGDNGMVLLIIEFLPCTYEEPILFSAQSTAGLELFSSVRPAGECA